MSQELSRTDLVIKSLEHDKTTKLGKTDPDDLFELNYNSNPEDEAINYLRQIIKLSKRKVRSKKIDNTGKVRWARAGVEASKILLYSGVIDRVERRRTIGEQYLLKDALAQFLQKKLQEGNKPTVLQEQKTYS